MKNIVYGILSVLILTSIHSKAFSKGMNIFVGEPTTPQCRNCHDNVKQFPMLITSNPNRHHLLIGTTIPPIHKSKAPDAIGAKNSGQQYECFSCHLMLTSEYTGKNEIIEPFRDCLQCHPAWRVTGNPLERRNVHKETKTVKEGKCSVCHGLGGIEGCISCHEYNGVKLP